MTINSMMKVIEQKTSVRMIWRCRSGWGIRFSFNGGQSAVFRYSPTLEACIRREYALVKSGKHEALKCSTNAHSAAATSL